MIFDWMKLQRLSLSDPSDFSLWDQISKKDLIFDIDEVLDMQWETWAYILYTWARIQSIIDTVWTIEYMDDETAASLLTQPEEFSLIKKIAEFDDMLLQAKNELATISCLQIFIRHGKIVQLLC